MRRRLLKILSAIFTVLLWPENGCLPAQKAMESDPLFSTARHSFRGFLPAVKARLPRADNGGVGGFLQTAVQDGIASTSAFTSPTLFLGGFSVMMQPMPNGTEFAGQLAEILPHYANFLPTFPGLPGFGRSELKNSTETENSIV